MSKFKNWLITKLLQKDRLVCVPEDWQKDYVHMAGQIVQKDKTLALIITEYNSLLKDYFGKCSIEELHSQLDSCEATYTPETTQEELSNLAYEEFKMAIEKE